MLEALENEGSVVVESVDALFARAEAALLALWRRRQRTALADHILESATELCAARKAWAKSGGAEELRPILEANARRTEIEYGPASEERRRRGRFWTLLWPFCRAVLAIQRVVLWMLASRWRPCSSHGPSSYRLDHGIGKFTASKLAQAGHAIMADASRRWRPSQRRSALPTPSSPTSR